ncbi:signal peptidase I [Streptomyces sp. NPDC051561]|uniref:signal peptidase I n=1 Tax=Streptomyces sp. NPDC051561 TaxID=3365658 RepID=UPI0037A61BA4
MDTEAAPHPERDRSPAPSQGPARRSRSARFPGRPAGALPGSRSPSGPGPVRSSDLVRRRGHRPLLLAVACVAFLLVLSSFVMQPFLIPSTSMQPTLQVGDRILVNKLAYRFGAEPARGDVVVFDGRGSFVREEPEVNPLAGALRWGGAALGLTEPAETDFVKRVVGVGGDRVVCCDKRGRLRVNGTSVEEPYLYPGNPPSRVPFDIVVPAGTLWMMGDHRSRSSDSRDHLGSPGGGMVPLDRVIGRADRIGWPFGRWGAVEPSDAFADVRQPAASHG